MSAACPPAFVVAGVQSNGVYTCRVRHESAGENDERWLDISFPAFVWCAPTEIAWAKSSSEVGCADLRSERFPAIDIDHPVGYALIDCDGKSYTIDRVSGEMTLTIAWDARRYCLRIRRAS